MCNNAHHWLKKFHQVAALSPEKHLKEIPVLDAPPAEKPLPLQATTQVVLWPD
jgi:hypothetical protein